MSASFGVIRLGAGDKIIRAGSYKGDPAIFISNAPDDAEVERIGKDAPPPKNPAELEIGETVIVFTLGRAFDVMKERIDKAIADWQDMPESKAP